MDVRKVSILSAVAASSCCVLPLILLGLSLLGVGTAGMAGFSSTLGALKWYIMPWAVIGVGLSYWFYFREKRKCATAACALRHRRFTKTMLIFSTLVVTGFLGWSVHPYLFGSTTVMVYDHAASAQLAVYHIDGMTCGGCELAIDGVIAATGLIDSVKSSFTEGKAYVWLAEPEVNNETILEAIASVGYEASLIQPE